MMKPTDQLNQGNTLQRLAKDYMELLKELCANIFVIKTKWTFDTCVWSFSLSHTTFGLGVPFKIFTARLGLQVRISQMHFKKNHVLSLSLSHSPFLSLSHSLSLILSFSLSLSFYPHYLVSSFTAFKDIIQRRIQTYLPQHLEFYRRMGGKI